MTSLPEEHAEQRAAWREMPFVRLGADGEIESVWAPWPPATIDDAPGAAGNNERHQIGAYYAFSLLGYERDIDRRMGYPYTDPCHFMAVIEAIVRQGAWRAVEQGFFYAIADLLFNGRAHVAGDFATWPDHPLGQQPPDDDGVTHNNRRR